MFSDKIFIVFALTFRSSIYFELIFVYGVRQGSKFILLHVDIQLSVVQQHSLKRPFFPPFNGLHTIVENQLAVNVRIYFWTLNSIDLCYS